MKIYQSFVLSSVLPKLRWNRHCLGNAILVVVTLNIAIAAQAQLQYKTPLPEGSQVKSDPAKSDRDQIAPARNDRPQTDQEKADQAKNLLYIHPPSNAPALKPNAKSTHAPPAPYAGPKVPPAPIVNRGPLPRGVSGADEEKEEKGENPDNLIRNWKNRRPMAEAQKAVHESLTMPSEPTKPTDMSMPTALPTATQDTLSTSGWEQIGSGDDNPDGKHYEAGRIRQASYAYDNTVNATTLWLGATGGGLWKAVDLLFAVIFVPMSDNLPGSPSVGAFLVQPGNSNNILIGSGDLLRYAGTGMYKTSDGAASWHAVNPTDGTSWPGTFQKILIDLHDPSGQTVLAQGDTGIWLSGNFGDTWTKVYSGPSTDLVQDPVNTYIWYAAVEGVGVLRSTSYGQFFNPIGSGITGPIGRISIAVSASAPEHLYAITATPNSSGVSSTLGGIWRSDDYGDGTWHLIESTDQISGPGQAFHTTSINVDPNNADIVFAGMANMEVTRNATASSPTWTYSTAGAFDEGHADHTSYVFEPGTSNVIATSDGGAYVIDENSLAVSASLNYNTNLNVEQVYGPVGNLACSLSDPDECISGLQDNGSITINRNNSPALYKVNNGDGAAASVAPNDANEMFDMSNGSRFYTTDNFASQLGDYGNCLTNNFYATTMIDQTPPGGFQPFIYTFSVPGSGGNYSYIYYKPVDPNCDWTAANPNAGFDINVFSPRSMDVSNDPSAYVFYVVGWSTAFLEVADSYKDGALGSMGYENRTPPVSRNSSFNDSQIAADRSSSRPYTVTYTTGGARPSQAFLSNDRGQSWTEVTGDLAAKLPSANYWKLIANPQDQRQLFLATDQGIYRSDNFGVNWYRYMNGMPAVADIYGLELNYDHANPPLLHVGTFGRGLWDRQVAADAVLSTVGLTQKVVGGQPAVGFAYLDRPAPQDTTVALTSSNPAVLPVPATVVIQRGASFALFVSHTTAVDATTVVSVTGNYNAVQLSATSTVTQEPTTTTVASSSNPSSPGQAVTFTASVSSSSGSPTGEVVFYDGSASLGSATLSGGSASFSDSSLASGKHSITAGYVGAGSFQASVSTAIVQVVGSAKSTVALASSNTHSTYGQPVMLAATVSGADGTASGAVTFKDGSTALGTVTLSGGQALFTTAALAVGTHSLTAAYAGNSIYSSSLSGTLSQVVTGAATATGITAVPNPSIFDQPITFTAIVKSTTTGTPTGKVTFKNGSTTLGTGTLNGGEATLSIATLHVDTHLITASYGGSTDFVSSTSAAVSVTINPEPTATTVVSSLNPSTKGKAVTFTATVKATYGKPAGTVTFYNGTTELHRATLSGGKATYSTKELSAGTHSIQAIYSGSSSFTESKSTVLSQKVKP